MARDLSGRHFSSRVKFNRFQTLDEKEKGNVFLTLMLFPNVYYFLSPVEHKRCLFNINMQWWTKNTNQVLEKKYRYPKKNITPVNVLSTPFQSTKVLDF